MIIIKISTKGRYALRIMVDLAINSNEKFVPIKDIATRQGISIKYSEQIISLLNKAGFLDVARGNTGGYKLSKNPDEYIIGDILRVTEGELSPIFCITDRNKCDRQNKCKTYTFWKGLDNVINDYVNSKTLTDLLN